MNRFFRQLALALSLSLAAAGAQAQVVVSQVYGGGGNTGAPYNRDFVELFNRGSEPVALGGKSVQYASGTGTGNFGSSASQLVALPTVVLQPGQYYLVGLGSGANGAPLPTPDAEGSIAMSATGGKVVLAEGTASLGCNGGSTPCTPAQAARIIDLVGFGSANYFEGAAPTAAPSNTTAVLRASNGCTDSNNNGGDFATGAPAPRNTATALNPCGGGGTPALSIADANAAEGAAGAGTEMLFTLSLNLPAGAGGVSVTYATSDGTANAGADYVAETDTVVIPAGATSATIGIALVGDDTPEDDETFFVEITAATGANIARERATGTIANDDIATVAIHDIQGRTDFSLLAGKALATRGIVTGRRSNGFFLQARDSEADADPMTSEGIFVFTGGQPPASALRGNEVIVQGTVVEYVPTADPGQLFLTEITGPTVTFVSAGNDLPAPVLLTADFPSPSGPLDQLERVEAMRVTAASFTVVAATAGNTSEPNATGSSNGQLNLVVTGTPRPFREPGIQAPDAPPAGTIPPIPRWDFNPELLFSDTDALGGQRYELAVGATLQNYVGPLDYGFRRYSVHQDPGVAPVITQGPAPAPARAPTADEFTFATYNMERFFDTVNDPAVDESVLTPAAFANRLNKASLGIREALHAPDILGVVEMENLSTLQAVASKVNADAVAAGQPDPQYVAYLEEGNDVGGIDVGFLVKTAQVRAGVARVQVLAVTQLGKSVTWTEPSGNSSLLNDRPPLALDAVVHYADGRAVPLTAVVVHQRSLNGAEDATASGERVRMKRQRQAEYLAEQLQAMQAADASRNIVVGGDFNAFEFNDGLTDAMGTVTGLPSADDATAVPGDGADLVDPDLFNVYVLEPEDQRYSFEFDGNAQSLDHILINQQLGAVVGAVALDHARINADFPETNRSDAGSYSRLSDHDPAVAYFSVASADLSIDVTAAQASVKAGEPMQWQVAVHNAGGSDAAYPGVGIALDAELADVTVTAPVGWSCDAPTVGNGTTLVACAAASMPVGGNAAFTVQASAPVDAIGGSVTLAASVDAESYDPDTGNNHDEAAIAVASLADLSVHLFGPLHKLHSGRTELFPVVIYNAGPDKAWRPEVVLSGNAPAANVSIRAPNDWTCAITGDAATFEARCSSTNALSVRRLALLPFRVLIPARQGSKHALQLTAQVDALGDDPVARNDTDTYSNRIVGGH